MIPANLKYLLQEKLSIEIVKIATVSGGDIHEAFMFEGSNSSKYFLKTNSTMESAEMLRTEALGLKLIRDSEKIPVPRVVYSGTLEQTAFLVLPFIETGHSSQNDWELFAINLAEMHHSGMLPFGLDHSNFIGRLPQSNSYADRWVDFYRTERLEPQMGIMKSRFPGESKFFKDADKLLHKLPSIIEVAEPSLIHGDLWGGNYLSSKEAGIYLIDPAVSIASREMDIAMSKLFGGFPLKFYEAYQVHYPLISGWEDRVPIYQLYYLLAHVNMFGRSYLGSARRAIQHYL
jgi:fructosamine-3-kinase